MAMAGSNEINGTECRSVVPLNTWVLISNFKLAYNLLRRPDGTFNRHLAEFLDRKVPANATPVDGVFSFDVVVHRLTNLLCRVYQPASPSTPPPDPSPTAPLPVILFFHGGSFAHSSSNSAIYDALCRRLVSMCHAVVISVNYRRAPEFRYPCAYDDGWAALNWAATRPWLHGDDGNEEEDDGYSNSNGGDGDGDVVESSSFSGKKKARIFLAGDSSGGNIAHNVALRSVGSGTKVSGVILLNPMFGGQERKDSELKLDGKYFVTLQDRDWYWKAFLPEGADRDHHACNPFGPNGIPIDGLSFPKSLVAVSGFNLLRDWQLDYADGLKRARQDVQLLYLKQATIGFYLLPNNDHFFLLMDEIKQFVNSSS